MRTIITSDPYRYHEKKTALDKLADHISEVAPDLFVIAGNLGEPVSNFESALECFSSLPCQKAVITGNRDIWHREGEHTSQQLWEEVLPSVIRRCGYAWLEQDNLIIKGVGVCGTVGWYDYSARDPTLGYTTEDYENLKGLVSKDSRHIDWQWSDREFSSHLQKGFASRLESLERDHAVNHIIVVTHIPIFKEAIAPVPGDAQWNFGTAYTFNLTLGRVIAPKTKVRHVVSGHTRLSGQWEIRFGNNIFKMHAVGFEDNGPPYVTIEV